MKHFYTKYIEINSLITELDSMDLSDEERMHLGDLIDSSLHTVILDEILSQLSDEDKEIFLQKLESKKDHQEIMEFLNQKIDKVEERITKVSEELVKELHEDIKESKKQ